MKMRTLAFTVVAILTAGCTHTHLITNDQWGFARFDEINEKAKGRKGQIVLVSGSSFYGKDIRVSSPLTSWFVPGSDSEKTVLTVDIKEIVFKSRGRGAMEGARIGGGLGMLAGTAAGLATGLSEGGYYVPTGVTALVGGAVGFAGGVLVGGVVGASIGAGIGRTDKYVITGK